MFKFIKNKRQLVRVGYIIALEFFIFAQPGFSLNISSGYIPFQFSETMPETGSSAALDPLMLPPAITGDEVQHPSQTIDSGEKYYPTFTEQPRSSLELVKIIEPSFLPKAQWLQEIASYQNNNDTAKIVQQSSLMQLLEMGNLCFTMNEELVPLYFYQLMQEGIDVSKSKWQWIEFGDVLESLPILLKQELGERGLFSAGYEVKSYSREFRFKNWETGEESNVIQIRSIIKAGDVEGEIIEYDFGDGENLYFSILRDNRDGKITSFLIQGNRLYSTPLYIFEHSDFTLAKTPVQVGNESSYQLSCYEKTQYGKNKLFEFGVDKVVVFDRDGERGPVSSLQYRIKTGKSLYLEGKEIPIEGVIEYRDVQLDNKFSMPISYRMASYTPADTGLHTAEYHRILAPGEELSVVFPVDGIEVAENEPANLIYEKHFSNYDIFIKNTITKSYREIQDMTNEEIKAQLISKGAEITIERYDGLEKLSLKKIGDFMTTSYSFHTGVEKNSNGKLTAYTFKNTYYSLPFDFSFISEIVELKEDGINAWIEELKSRFKTAEKLKYYEERLSSSEEKQHKKIYFIDFKTGETTVSEKITKITARDEDDTLGLDTSYRDEEVSIYKYKQIPESTEEGYDFEALNSDNLIWVQKVSTQGDKPLAIYFDYQNDKAVVFEALGKEEFTFKEYNCSEIFGALDPAKSTSDLKSYFEGVNPLSAGIARFSKTTGMFKKIWELKKEGDNYTYSITPIESLEQGSYHLYELLQYTGELGNFISGETVEINLVEELNRMAEEMGAGRDKAASFIQNLNKYWLEYRRMLLLEIASLGAEIVDNYDGSESCNYILKVRLPEEAKQKLVEKKNINIEVNGDNITIAEHHPQLGTISRKVEMILGEGSKKPLTEEEKFNFLYKYYLCEYKLNYKRLNTNYYSSENYLVKEINILDSLGIKRIKIKFDSDGKLTRIEYPDPREGAFQIQGDVLTFKGQPKLVYEEGKPVIPEKIEWSGERATAWLNAKLRGLSKILGSFLHKYSDFEIAEREGKIENVYGAYIIDIQKEPPVNIILVGPDYIHINYGGYSFLFEMNKDDDSYKVQISAYGKNEEFKSNAWVINSFILQHCYPFLAKGLNGENLDLEMARGILVSLKNKLESDGIGVPEGEYLKYSDKGPFRVAEEGISRTSLLEDKFFSKVRDFLYYYSLAKVSDQALKEENDWISLPSRGNLTDILASYPLTGFEWLNDLIVSCIGDNEEGHTAYSRDASKLYFAHSIVTYDKNSGMGYLTHQNYYKTEFEFGDNKEAFGDWVKQMLGEKATAQDIDTLWSMYQLAKAQRNIGIFYYYCRGAFIDGDKAELERLRVASESEAALKAVYEIMQDPAILNQAGIDFRNRYKKYFKYLTLPDYGDEWSPLDGQIVLEPNRANITWETIGALIGSLAVYAIDRTGILAPILSKLNSMGWFGKVLGWGLQTAVGSVRGASIFSIVYGLPMLIGQTGEVDLIRWLNTLGQNFLTGLIYSALFGILFTPAQFGIGDMPPLIGLLGRPIEKLLRFGASRLGSYYPTLAKGLNGTAWLINKFLTFGNELEAYAIGFRRLPDGSRDILASMTNWRYIAWYYPTEVIMEEMVLPTAMDITVQRASKGLLFHEAPMFRTFRALAIGNLRNTETAGSIAEMTDPLENPLGFILLPGIVSVFQKYGLGGVLGFNVPTD